MIGKEELLVCDKNVYKKDIRSQEGNLVWQVTTGDNFTSACFVNDFDLIYGQDSKGRIYISFYKPDSDKFY